VCLNRVRLRFQGVAAADAEIHDNASRRNNSLRSRHASSRLPLRDVGGDRCNGLVPAETAAELIERFLYKKAQPGNDAMKCTLPASIDKLFDHRPR
jgi:hypothetical protein